MLADSLYASEPVFEKCVKDNGWHFLVRYKDGSIPSVAEEYRSICGFGGPDSLEGTIKRTSAMASSMLTAWTIMQ